MKRESGPSLKKLSKDEARAKYNYYAGNHPTIHCNRMANWEELSKAEKRKWRDPLYLAGIGRDVANVRDGKGSA